MENFTTGESGGIPQDLSGIPVDDAMFQLQLKRKLAMADALRQQEMPQGQMVSGHYVAPSWTQQLAGLANKYVAGQQEQNAMKEYGQAQQAKSAKLGALLTDLQQGKATTTTDNTPYQIQVPNGPIPTSMDNLGGMQPYNNMKSIDVPMTNTSTSYSPYSQQEYMAKIGAVMPDMLPKMLEANFANRFKEETPIISHAGDIGRDRNGKIIFQNPAKEDKTTFSTLGKLTSELQQIQSANPNDPRIPQYQDAIKKETTASQVSESNIGKLTSEINALPLNDPRRKTYEAAIRKETTVPSDYSQQNFAYNKARGLREDFAQLPETKAWNVIQPILVSVREAAKDTTGGSDLNLIYGMGKIMDPNSVVREGELQMAGNTGSLGQKIQGYYKSVANGGRLPPSVKQDLLNQIESRAKPQQMLYENTKKKYTEIAKRNQLNPEDLFVEGITTPTTKTVNFGDLK